MPLRMAKYATFLLNMLETPGFWALAITCKVQNEMQGLQKHFEEVISIFESVCQFFLSFGTLPLKPSVFGIIKYSV